MTRKPKLGLALGAGGARGWCHLGVLDVLAQLGLKADIIAGCSMGALVGAAEAGGKRAQLHEWALDLTQSKFLSLVDIRLSSGGLIEGREIANILSQWDLDCPIEELDIPFVAVATDIGSGREIWLREGPLLPAIRASVAIPGLFAPQKIAHRWLMDGGATNPVPVSVCRALGADVIISVNPNANLQGRYWMPETEAGLLNRLERMAYDALPEALRPEPSKSEETPPQSLDVANAAIDIMSDYLRRTRAAADPADLAIEVDLSTFSIFSFDQARTAIEAGHSAAEAQADRIAELCKQ